MRPTAAAVLQGRAVVRLNRLLNSVPVAGERSALRTAWAQGMKAAGALAPAGVAHSTACRVTAGSQAVEVGVDCARTSGCGAMRAVDLHPS